MPTKPRIAISMGCSRTNERAFQAQLPYSYVYSVAVAGAAPMPLPATEDLDILDTWLESVDGLVLSGGPDLDPASYGESPHPMVEPVSGPRAGFDLRLCKRAFERGLPILGICHGCQVVNVALGGSLHQDILTAFPDSPVVHRRRIPPFYVAHPVRVEAESLLRGIVEAERIETNSAHHQSVKDLAPGLRAVAWADDGVVEAIEWAGDGVVEAIEWAGDDRFLLGIQWHPEKLAEVADGPHRALFRALADAALRRWESRSLVRQES